ncbi:MAG: AIPR family protein [Patescibacteria group bacterium]|jgi:hypothetical protein
MTSTLIKFPAVSFRRIIGPHDDLRGKMYIAIVNVKDVPESLDDWRKLNPRDPKTNSGVALKIKSTLEDNPEAFLLKNRGITLMVEKVDFDNQTNEVKLEMVNEHKNGLLDGGHTFKIIRNYLEGLSKDEISEINAYVRIEILEGIKDIEEAVGIVESRNTSTQVKEQSIEELKKNYEEIKNVLKDQPYAENIAYKEFELLDDGSKKNIDIKDILSYLVCFDVESFTGEKHPIKAYSTKANVVQHFRDNQERMLKYIPLLPVILELRDFIYLELPEAYNHAGGKFGGLTGVVELSNKARMHKEKLAFTDKESTYRIPSSFIYPILASFRNLVRIEDGKCSWKTNPIKFFRELKGDLAARLGDQAKELRNPNKLGKDIATWGRCYDLVAIEALKRSL